MRWSMSGKNTEGITKVAALMRDLDFCMMTTSTDDGHLRARPMSNNGEVEFDGDVWFFTDATSRKVREIEANPLVHLSYADLENFTFISMSGAAEIVRDDEKKMELWIEELRRWFEDGPTSDDVVLIKVTPVKVACWSEEGEEELSL